jgi:hypothetical protein
MICVHTREDEMVGAPAVQGENRNACRIFAGKFEGKRPLRRLRRRYEDNIEMYCKEVGREVANWINLVHDRKKLRAMSCWFPHEELCSMEAVTAERT